MTRWLTIAVAVALLLGRVGAEPASAPATASDPQRQHLHRFYSHEIVEAYPHAGRHDPAWDADARLVLEALTRQLAWSYCPGGDEWDVIMSAGRRATEGGCTDPLVLFALARGSAYFNRRPEDISRLHVEASRRAGESAYHPLLKCFTSFPAASLRARDRGDSVANRRAARRMIEAGMDAFARALADPQVPPGELLKVLAQLGDASRYVERDRATWIDKALPLLAETHKDRPALLATARMQFLIDYAKDARRDALPSPADAEKLWAQRLADAAALAEAALTDPGNSRAVELLMQLESMRGGNAEAIDRWFQRGIAASGACYPAYATRLALFDPAWKDQADAMLALARRAAATGDFESGLPMLLIESHLRAASYRDGQKLPEPRADYFNPDVWAEIQGVYEPYLQQYPDSIFHRSRYASLAFWAGEKQVARRVLDSLGNDYSITWFRSKDAWQTLQSQLADR